jgi:hypothetical protein
MCSAWGGSGAKHILPVGSWTLPYPERRSCKDNSCVGWETHSLSPGPLYPCQSNWFYCITCCIYTGSPILIFCQISGKKADLIGQRPIGGKRSELKTQPCFSMSSLLQQHLRPLDIIVSIPGAQFLWLRHNEVVKVVVSRSVLRYPFESTFFFKSTLIWFKLDINPPFCLDNITTFASSCKVNGVKRFTLAFSN